MPLVIMLVKAWLYHWQCIDFAMAIALTIQVAILFVFLSALSLAMQLVPKCYADIYSPWKLLGATAKAFATSYF
jgi:hypothetical protein